MNIVFLGIHNKTIFFLELAKKLQAAGHQIYWISPSRVWSAWLREHGVSENRLLNIANFGPEWARGDRLSQSQLQEIEELEKFSQMSLRNVILMDRLLSRKPYRYAMAYLYNYQKLAKNFLLKNEIQVVLSEQCYAHEIVNTMLCRKLSIPCYNFGTVRIPSEQFGFFKDHYEQEFAIFKNPDEQHRAQARTLYHHFVETKQKPYDFNYILQNNGKYEIKANWFLKFFKNLQIMIL